MMRLRRFGVAYVGVILIVSGGVVLSTAVRADESEAAETHAIISDADVLIIDDDRLQKQFEDKVAALIGDSPDGFVERREAQLPRRRFALDLPAAGARRMTPAQIYRQRIDSVGVVGVFYHCQSKNCKRLHSSLSSGVVIHEDGVLLTNYHVVDVKQPRMLAMAVMTVDGRVFLVDEVLAADPAHDVAAVKLRDAAGLSAVPVFRDEPVGRPVTLITRPRRHFFSLSSGYVSRYSMGDKTNLVMNITADYAVGSSGGAVFNNRGDIVGLVSSTTSIAAGNVRIDQGNQDGVLQKLFGRGESGDRGTVFRCESNDPPDVPQDPEADTPREEEKEPQDPEDDTPREEEKAPPIRRPPSRSRASKVNIPTNHQMTIKNTVPSRAILDLFAD